MKFQISELFILLNNESNSKLFVFNLKVKE